jgi:hypothetical protein
MIHEDGHRVRGLRGAQIGAPGGRATPHDASRNLVIPISADRSDFGDGLGRRAAFLDAAIEVDSVGFSLQMSGVFPNARAITSAPKG